jgi:putative transposase
MPRIGRIVVKGEQAIYHVMSRTALDGYPLGDLEKETLVNLIKKKSRLYFTHIIGFCVMGNHFHVLVRMLPESDFSNADIKSRYLLYYEADKRIFPEENIPYFRQKWASVSEFTREIKLDFARYYNKLHNRRGYFWGDRFKSVLVERGQTLINCLAYIDLNPIRAGLVEKPEDYRWCSLGYHVQTGNKDNFLSLDFGLSGFTRLDPAERLARYRRYVYEAGAIARPENPSKTIDSDILEKERETGFNLDRINRFRYRTRYFTDSGIIGTKAFVSEYYQQFKNLFSSKNDKRPKPIKGIEGAFSLKRLSESI